MTPRHPAGVLAKVRRYEAAGFRAWPAAAVHYDGTWVVRLTAGHPAKRLNSITPLDPGDIDGMADRIGRASRRFEAYGRPLTFRLSPLAGSTIAAHLDAEGWRKLTFRWGLFFLFLAVLNEVVWRSFSTDFWVAFKVWATIPITILFTVSQMPLVIRHSLDDKAGK